MFKVTVIIACFNEEKILAATLDGLVAQEFDGAWEILFADNGSTDRSAEIFRSHAAAHPQIALRYIDASAQQGKSFALNLAIPQARAPHVLLCDADDVPAPGWLKAAVDALERHEFVACRAELDRLNRGWVRHYRPYNASLTGLGRTSYPPYAAYGGGNTLGFHQALYQAVGPFDLTAEPLEDIDFCIRAHLAGYRLEFVPDAVMHVRFRDTVAGLYRQKYRYAIAAVILSGRYGAHEPKGVQAVKRNIRRFQRNFKLWLGVVPDYIALRLEGRHHDPLEYAAFHWRLANAAGKFAGMIRHRHLPP